MIRQVESRTIKFTPSVLIEEVDQDGNQCGFAVLEPWGVYLFLRLLYVHSDKRREGIAKRLVDKPSNTRAAITDSRCSRILG